MKRVLVISYYWPPTGGSGVQRWVKFSKYLPAQGWQPVIYTPENPEQLAVDESLLRDVPQDVEVIKTPILEPYGLYRKLTGKKITSKGEGVNPLNAQHKSLRQRLAVWMRGNFFIPDPRVFWVRPSVRFLVKYLKEHPVDVIVTTGPPQSMHLIGRDVMRKLRRCGGKLPKWVVDFRDPWTEMFYFKHMGLTGFSKRVHKRLEQSVLDECDTVVAVSPPVQADFAACTATPVELITNGFDEDDFSAAEIPDSLRFDGKFVIAHTGLFASDGNPVELWRMLSSKCGSDPQLRESLRIVLSGKTDGEVLGSIVEYGLEKNLVNLGYQPHSLTVALQRRADVLILPLRREPEYAKVLPGKIFEYLASRRPVLGIGQMDGAAAKVLADSGAGRMYDWECGEDFAAFVGREYDEWKKGTSAPAGGNIAGYTRRALAAKMAGLFEKLQ